MSNLDDAKQLMEKFTLKQRGKAIRYFRKQAGLSLDEFGAGVGAGLTGAMISAFERGKSDFSLEAFSNVVSLINDLLSPEKAAAKVEVLRKTAKANLFLKHLVKTHKAKPPSHEEAAAALAEGFNQAREAREARHDKGLRDLHDKMQSQNAAFLKLHEQFEQTPTIGLFHELRIAMENCKETSSLFKAKIMELKAKKFESLELLSREVEESLRRENEWLAEQAQGVASGVLSKPDAQDGGE